MPEKFDIDLELKSILEKNLLPARIVDRIGKKIKENNISISKEQLYELVNKIQGILQNYSKNKQTITVEKRNGQKTPVQSPEEVQDMKKLVETVEELKERIKSIEEQRLEGVKGVSGRIIKTKDMMNPQQEIVESDEPMQPLELIPNDPESIVVLMKWLQYLVDKIGKNNLPDILSYYVDIDWITDDVRLDLIEYSKGISDSTAEIKEPPKLVTKDHIQSLLFIQKLKGKNLNERFIWKIDREMEKMAKSIEEYQLK
ncbi:MAG: FlaD/FlaE family flagellar protein [Candidatus Thermoplasmatota archaeon]